MTLFIGFSSSEAFDAVAFKSSLVLRTTTVAYCEGRM